MDLLDKDSSPYSKLRTKKNKFLGAIIGGAAAIGGSLLGKKSQKDANSANAAEAQANRDFQERMVKFKHRYEVNDLRKAGLNPILSAHSGASVPGGAQAVHQATIDKNMGNSAAQTLQAARQISADIKLKKELAKTEKSKQNLNIASAHEASARTELAKGSVGAFGTKFPMSSAFGLSKSLYSDTIQGFKHYHRKYNEALYKGEQAAIKFGKKAYKKFKKKGGKNVSYKNA